MTEAATLNLREDWTEEDGHPRLFVRHWEPAGPARASLVICHGVNSLGGQYLGAAQAFADRGFAVTALDLRGRGRSEGERYFVEKIGDYVSDLSRSRRRRCVRASIAAIRRGRRRLFWRPAPSA